MNFRKSLRSLHQQGSHSVKKIELNNFDLQDCNNYAQSVQSTKESENSILNKLLLQPPSTNQQSNKLSLQSTKKYQPKFTKPDIQNLIQQNINLKNVIQSCNQSMNQLKIKNIQFEKKIKLLQKGLEKIEKEQSCPPIKQNSSSSNKKQQFPNKTVLTQNKKSQFIPSQLQPFAKTGIVHTQILKKKITDLTSQNISAQKQLKFLKKLPNITIYEQNDTQKQHLIAQTIRLKSIITSLSQQPSSDQSQKFQNQFMRLMKEQNEKLKATIRLLQNDKILLKSRQTIQNKLNSDLKKQIQHFKTKLLYKQSQLQKINNQNKNLLFKKTTEFRQQQQKKQNQLVSELRSKLLYLENQKVKLEQNNQFYCEENMNLKDKEKNLTQDVTDFEVKFDKLVKKLNQEIDELQFELTNVKNDYINLLNSGSLKKKKSLGINKQPSAISNSYMRQSFHAPSPLATQKFTFPTNTKMYSRPIKWQDIALPTAHLYLALEQNSFLTIQSLINNVQENDHVRCGDLVSIFSEEPFNMIKKQATKLARYICEDSSVLANTKVLQNQNLTIESSLAKNILTSSLQKMTNKLSQEFFYSWQNIFTKTKKLPYLINQFIQGKSHINRQELCEVLNKCSRQKVQCEQYDFLMLKCMDKELSEEDFVLQGEKIREFIDSAMSFVKQNKNQ